MKLDFDPAWLRTSMSMWRDATDLKVPLHDDFKVHFIEQRSSILAGFIKTATAFSMVLRACKAEGEDLRELEALRTEVDAFKKWAETGLNDLNTMALQESMKDNMQQLLADPDVGNAVRKLIQDINRPGKGTPPK